MARCKLPRASDHADRERALAVVLRRLVGFAEMLEQPRKRTMRAHLQRIVVGQLERRLEERLRLAPQLLLLAETAEREQQVGVFRVILLPALRLLDQRQRVGAGGIRIAAQQARVPVVRKRVLDDAARFRPALERHKQVGREIGQARRLALRRRQ